MTSEPLAARRPAADLYGPRMRTLVYLSAFFVIAGSAAFAVLVGTGWSWPLFIWAAVLTPAVLLVDAAVFRLLARSIGAGQDVQGLKRARARRRRRHLAIDPPAIGAGVGWGVIAASSQVIWADIAFTAFFVLTEGVALLVFLRLKRQIAARQRPPT